MHRWSEALTVGELGTKEREIEPGSKQAAGRDEAEPREQPPIHSYLASRKTLVMQQTRNPAKGNHCWAHREGTAHREGIANDRCAALRRETSPSWKQAPERPAAL